MGTTWPFTGRGATLDEVRELLGTGGGGRGVVVAGEAGVGKTRLAAEALRGLEPGRYRVVRVGATRAGARIPFGAFGHVLPARRPGTAVVNPLRWAADAVGAQGDPARLLLAVDDAHLLDPSSAALVHHLVVHERARVLATVRAGEAMPDPVLALWKDELARRLELEPLPAAETGAVLEAVLGGQVEDGTTRRLWRETRGNLLFLRELVLAGTAAGRLGQVRGVWRWKGDLPVSPRLGELVGARLGAVGPEELAVLEYVTFGEPVGVPVLAALTSPEAVERAEERHMIVCARRGRRLQAWLAHPLFGEVTRDRTPVLRARRRRAALADTVERTGMRRREDLLRVAVWRLDSGTAADPALALQACLRARGAYDLALAERFARAALDAGGGLEAALPLAGILYVTGRGEEGEALLESVAASPADRPRTDRERSRYATTRALGLVLALGRGDDALRLLDEARAGMTGRVELRDIDLLGARVHLLLGEFAQAREALGRVRSSGRLREDQAVHAIAAECLETAHAGRTGECLRLAGGLPRGAAGPRHEVSVVELDIACARMSALLFSGAAGRAETAGRGMIERFAGYGEWDLGVAGLLGHRAQVQRARGAVQDALRSCREGVARLGAGSGDGRTGFAGLCHGEMAHSAALLGDLPAAERALAEAARRTLPTYYLVDFPHRLAGTWVTLLRDGASAARDAALATAAEAAARGMHGYEMFALHDAVRLGDPGRAAARLAELAVRVDGPLVRACARHAASAVARDGDALDAVAEDFAGMGLLLHAAEAAAMAARAHRRAGAARASQASEIRAWGLARHCQGARTPALTGLAAPGLTERQLEVARLAAQGLGNREIAERLVLSVRTVANHLGAVYERLGVRDRGDLPAALTRDGPPAGPQVERPRRDRRPGI
ncbi:hypothetical protein AGRA3207_006213 [Actinomadura graeca]|uniref:HTH luxR-type domain-containing protein n=1 Tax=Actinomadura graeca TaxID=2750812 RepID=A0ABX8R304_9ACTN|nr:LuxR C-terminal-related transcriptional regulator [Actinomadura graeca]QXJ24814.1 hypothetical protein AGRA3207_006213 [Actinomadura graeca]